MQNNRLIIDTSSHFVVLIFKKIMFEDIYSIVKINWPTFYYGPSLPHSLSPVFVQTWIYNTWRCFHTGIIIWTNLNVLYLMMLHYKFQSFLSIDFYNETFKGCFSSFFYFLKISPLHCCSTLVSGFKSKPNSTFPKMLAYKFWYF